MMMMDSVIEEDKSNVIHKSDEINEDDDNEIIIDKEIIENTKKSSNNEPTEVGNKKENESQKNHKPFHLWCIFCDTYFETQDKLKEHITNVLECSYCGLWICKGPLAFKEHVNIHEKVKYNEFKLEILEKYSKVKYETSSEESDDEREEEQEREKDEKSDDSDVEICEVLSDTSEIEFERLNEQQAARYFVNSKKRKKEKQEKKLQSKLKKEGKLGVKNSKKGKNLTLVNERKKPKEEIIEYLNEEEKNDELEKEDASGKIKKIKKEEIIEYLDEIQNYENELLYSNESGSGTSSTMFNRIKTENEYKENYTCRYCLREFAAFDALEEHRKIHGGSKPFICAQCGIRFQSSVPLNRHVLAHKEKKFKCKYCGKSYKHSLSLKEHIIIHAKGKPYQCNICGKGFIVPNVYQNHLRRHTGEGIVSCCICSREFISEKALNKHLRMHANKRHIECPLCTKVFVNSNYFATHVLGHKKDGNVTCKVCNNVFNISQYLSNHIKKDCSDEYTNIMERSEEEEEKEVMEEEIKEENYMNEKSLMKVKSESCYIIESEDEKDPLLITIDENDG